MGGGRTCRFDCTIILKLNFKIIKFIMSVLFSCVKFWLPTSSSISIFYPSLLEEV